MTEIERLIERLREIQWPLTQEAANEIERRENVIEQRDAEIERLNAEIKRLNRLLREPRG
jgi:hypothetical protein